MQKYKKKGDFMEIKPMLLTPNPYSRPRTKLQQVNAVAVHYVGNPGTSAINNRNYFENLKDTHKTKASSHYIVGLQGEILQLIPETEWSYCTNERNRDTISIETCHPDFTGKFNQVTYNSLVELCADICKRHGLDPINSGLIRHYDVTGKVCPKWFVDYPGEWEKFKKEVRKSMEQKELTAGEAAAIVRDKAGLDDNTMQYIDFYRYGKELILKLAKAMM